MNHSRCSPYERGATHFSHNGKSDEKGSRLARPDPIYETLFSGANGRPARTVGTQVGLQNCDNYNEDHEQEMTFTLLNSFWFMIASLLQQGTDLLPRYLHNKAHPNVLQLSGSLILVNYVHTNYIYHYPGLCQLAW